MFSISIKDDKHFKVALLRYLKEIIHEYVFIIIIISIYYHYNYLGIFSLSTDAHTPVQ